METGGIGVGLSRNAGYERSDKENMSIGSTWTIKLARRLMALPEGRYQITLSKEGEKNVTWTVTALGKLER